MGTHGAPVAFPPAIPAEVRGLIAQFAQSLQQQLQDNLLSVTLFGGVAKGKFEAGRSDINLLIVLSKANAEALEILRTQVAETERKGVDLALMTICPDELLAAAEVFPVKLLDMRLHHVVIVGSDYLTSLEISPERLRRQSIRELLNLQLRLRQTYIERWGEPGALRNFLQQSYITLFINLEAMLQLQTGKTFRDRSQVVAEAATKGFRWQILDAVLAFVEGKTRLAPDEVKKLYRDYAEQVDVALTQLEAGK